MVAIVKHSNLIQKFENYGRNKFYNMKPWTLNGSIFPGVKLAHSFIANNVDKHNSFYSGQSVQWLNTYWLNPNWLNPDEWIIILQVDLTFY